MSKLYEKLDSFCERTRELWEQRYPCGEGGWMHYRVLNRLENEDVKELIKIKKKPVRF